MKEVHGLHTLLASSQALPAAAAVKQSLPPQSVAITPLFPCLLEAVCSAQITGTAVGALSATNTYVEQLIATVAVNLFHIFLCLCND